MFSAVVLLGLSQRSGSIAPRNVFCRFLNEKFPKSKILEDHESL